jgi:predicted acyl esterase
MTQQAVNNDVAFLPGNPPENAGWPGGEYSRTVADDMQIYYNVKVPMRDGKNLLVDLYRPAETTTDLPVLVAWAPYGKHGALSFAGWPGHDVDLDQLSKYAAFETPDPAFWTRNGYAVIMADARGAWGSEGDVTICAPEEADACCDLIEWAGEQDWSNGKVGMAGVSWYAVIQWAVAARRPAHLAAINPWEGWTDLYKEVLTHGGIPETQFGAALGPLIANTHGRVEDILTNSMNHPFYDEYWQSKAPDLAAIEVPAYVVASWSDHGLHTRGTLEGFRRISSKQKWLEVHGRKKWQNFYDQDSLARQREFFDHFLKGEENTVESWPKVRIEVRQRAYLGENRAENEWPLTRTEYTPLYLNTGRGSLTTDPAPAPENISYDAQSGKVAFDHTFGKDTEVTGYTKLRLWVEAQGSNDMDLFVALQKIDAAGKEVNFPFFSTFDDGNVALGWLRVSRRQLAEDSRPEQPRYTHQSEELLTEGEIVPVDIEIWPSSTLFRAGETLRLIIQGHDVNSYEQGLFAQGHTYTRNSGRHIIHSGNGHDSHLLLPIIP